MDLWGFGGGASGGLKGHVAGSFCFSVKDRPKRNSPKPGTTSDVQGGLEKLGTTRVCIGKQATGPTALGSGTHESGDIFEGPPHYMWALSDLKAPSVGTSEGFRLNATGFLASLW